MDFVNAYGPVPIPCPPGLFRVLLGATFYMHLLAVQMLIGMLVISFAHALLRKRNAPHETLPGVKQLPIVMAVLINLGIPPLLFLQLIYGPVFYTSSILLGYLWMGVIPMLMLAYGGLYAARYAKRNVTVKVALGISLSLVIGIAYIYSNNMSWMLTPSDFQTAYSQGGLGGHLYPNQALLFSRWTWVLAPSLAVAAAWLGAGRGWMIASALLGLAGCAGFYTQCPCPPPQVLFGFDAALSVALLAAALLIRDKAQLKRSVLAWALVKAGSIVFVRDQVRATTLGQSGFTLSILEDHQLVSNTWVAFALFVAFAIWGFWSFGWMFKNGRSGLSL